MPNFKHKSLSSPGRYLALLRGINVGGKNKLPMKELASLFSEAGCREVQTYIQSGNVLFGAQDQLARRIPEIIAQLLESRLGLRVPVVMRTSNELRAIAKANPLDKPDRDPKTLHVVFLAEVPPQERVDELDPNRSPPDIFAVRGREIYLYCPNGVARSKLTNAYFDRKLRTVSTVRNWKTVLKLDSMFGE